MIDVVFNFSSCLKNIQSISLIKNDSKDVDNFITPSRPKSKYQTGDILEGDVKNLLSILEIKILRWFVQNPN